MHGPDGMLLPRNVAVNGVSAYVQNLGIERGELLAIGVERRQLFPSSRRPIQRMKSHQNIFLAAEIAELDFCALITFDCWQFEVGCSIANLQCHVSIPPRWHSLSLCRSQSSSATPWNL